MKKCPNCGQDNPSMYSHCEWCGHDIENVPDTVKEKKEVKKKYKPETDKKKSTNGKNAFKIGLKWFSVLAMVIFIFCIIYLTVVFSFSLPYFIAACLCIILAYLLNVFPSLFVKKRAESVKIRALLTVLSIFVIAGAVVLMYFGIYNS